jgi:DNA-directed RNA polymerase specialized sigma24 family protein
VKSLVKRLVQRVGKADRVRTDPRFEDARGPNVRELRCVQRRLSQPEVEALLADYEAGGRFRELAKVYGIHRTTVSAHVARAGKTRG